VSDTQILDTVCALRLRAARGNPALPFSPKACAA